MDYEEKYNDMIARLKSLAAVQPAVTKAAIESQFPEIVEIEDERMIQYFKDLAPFDKAEELYEKYGFSHKDAIAWLEKQGEQKPAWSEEDEEYLKAAIWYAENPAPNVAKNAMLVEWVKNLKGRVQPQPNQEWSEEDRKMMRNIIDDIHCGTNFNPKVMHAANEREKWFKSICMRYQSKWKPSDEQVEALLKLEEMHVLEHERNQENAHLYMVVKSIREQLLKLREE